MRISEIKLSDKTTQSFRGTRVLTNTVAQLAKNNKYSLSEPNQRYITNSIGELGRIAGKKIIDFLITTAEKIKYSTNIKLQDKPNNDWKEMLVKAAESSLGITKGINPSDYTKKIQELRQIQELNDTEKEILKLRDTLIKDINLKQIKSETHGGIKDFERNLDYFIISSETTLEHKKYVLSRLNYLMSDKYKINEQLTDKKSIVAAELVNDIAICTPNHKIPNIKAIDQKQHGICAAISIVRKKIAYEDKPNYIDSILSELDNSDYISVFDRSKLGTGKKILLKKVPVDFSAALAKGYRIIDASATQWMQLANQSGYTGNSLDIYTPFDKSNFDVNTDSFYNAPFEEPELKDLQIYYQALIKAGEIINNYKANGIKHMLEVSDKKQNADSNIKALNDVKRRLNDILPDILPSGNKIDKLYITGKLLKLQKDCSYDIKSNDTYSYISNEEESAKKDKIKNFLLSNGIDDTQVNETNLQRIYDLVEHHHILAELIPHGKSGKSLIYKAQKLYEIAAGTRLQFIKGLKTETTLNYMMKKEHIENEEECLKNHVDKLLKKLNSSDNNNDLIISSLKENTEATVNNKEDAINLLTQIKQRIDKIIGEDLDKIYSKLDMHDKNEALIQYLETIQLNIAETDDKNFISYLADNLGVQKNPDKLFTAIEEIKEGLSTGKYTYDEIFNKIGCSSQLLFAKNMLEDFVHNLSTEQGKNFLSNYMLTKNIGIDELEGTLNAELSKITNNIMRYSAEIENYSNILKIKDSDGNLIYSPSPADIIIKHLENSNTIPSEKDLKELQIHLDKIENDYSTDEFSTRSQKLSDKSLYKFSDNEKKTLGSIQKNINPLTRYLKKQLSYVQQYIKEPLEELKRIIGVENGIWWVTSEGKSGLLDGQGIRVLEYITGRPHHDTKDIKTALEKIKTSPYSGISSSSVSHSSLGMHAQYIADIEPVKIKDSQGNEKTVDVLFHDNTWGATEHENIWTDSKGLTRTDYRANRGGTLGYITNDKYRNGNIVDRVIKEMVVEDEPEIVNSHQYKKLKKGDDDSFNLPQYLRIALDGRSSEAKSIATSIHDTLFMPTSRLIDTIKLLTKDMSAEDIKNRLHSIKTYKNDWESISEKIIHRIHDKDSSNAVNTQDDYNRLPDNDIMKIALEKTALLNNYSIDDLAENLANIKNVKELNRYKRVQFNRAVKNFEYSFNKNIDSLDYLANSLDDEYDNLIETFLKRHKINLSDEEFEDIFYSIEVDSANFDGNLKNTITQISQNIHDKLQNKLKNENEDKDLIKSLRTWFEKKLYFNETDINKPEISHIIKFIDKNYNPEDNAQLVKIYRSLQNLTHEEFKQQVIPKLTNPDLNIKDETGYSLLKKIQHYEEGAENKLYNSIYIDELKNKTETSKSYREYVNNKLHRTEKILSKYNFDSAYREIKNDLSLLDLDKLFDKYKDANINKYGAYPAYPRVEYITDSVINVLVNTFIDPITDEIEQTSALYDLKRYYEISDEFKEYTKKFTNNQKLSDTEFEKLNNFFGELATLTYNDDSQAEVNEAATQAMEIEPNSEFKNYKKYINKINRIIDSYKKTAPLNVLEQEIENNKILISKQADMLAKTYIRDRYQNRFYSTLNQYKHSLINRQIDSEGKRLSDKYKEELLDELYVYNVLQEPSEALDRYIESLAKDSELNKYSSSIENLLKRAVDYSKLCDIQSTVMQAVKKGIETDVKSAFSNIQITLQDGTTTTMSSGGIIANMIHSLVYDKDEETALFFLDKLGLNEIYVKHICDHFNYNEIKDMINESAKSRINYNNFTNQFNEAYKLFENDLDQNKNPIKSINKLRKVVLDSGKANFINKDHYRIFLDAIELCKESWKANPFIPPYEIANSILYKAGTDFNSKTEEYFKSNEGILDSHESIISLVNNVRLNPNSDAQAARTALNKKFDKLIAYNNKLINNLQPME